MILTKEQAEALALVFEERAKRLWSQPERRVLLGVSPHRKASVYADIARELRDGKLIEATPPETGQ